MEPPHRCNAIEHQLQGIALQDPAIQPVRACAICLNCTLLYSCLPRMPLQSLFIEEVNPCCITSSSI